MRSDAFKWFCHNLSKRVDFGDRAHFPNSIPVRPISTHQTRTHIYSTENNNPFTLSVRPWIHLYLFNGECLSARCVYTQHILWCMVQQKLIAMIFDMVKQGMQLELHNWWLISHEMRHTSRYILWMKSGNEDFYVNSLAGISKIYYIRQVIESRRPGSGNNTRMCSDYSLQCFTVQKIERPNIHKK